MELCNIVGDVADRYSVVVVDVVIVVDVSLCINSLIDIL